MRILERERERDRERERECVCKQFVGSIARSVMTYAGLGLSGPSRHNRKRGCFCFVILFVRVRRNEEWRRKRKKYMY